MFEDIISEKKKNRNWKYVAVQVQIRKSRNCGPNKLWNRLEKLEADFKRTLRN